MERTITPHISASSDVEVMSREIYSGTDRFMASKHVRAIGFTCFALVVLLALLGLIVERRELAFLGSVGFILPIHAYFILHMSFLVGLQILTVLWAPFRGDMVRLGDVAYVPYMVLVYPFSLAGVFVSLGLLLFVLGYWHGSTPDSRGRGRRTSGSTASLATRSTWAGLCGATG